MRCFIAIEMPDRVQAVLADLQNGLRTGRHVAPENMHLTLRFLDDQPDDALEELHTALQAISRPAFDLSLEGIGTFGSGTPRAIFAGVAQSAPLTTLQSQVTRAIRRAGIELPRARFHPHVTLARFPREAAEGQGGALAAFLSAAAGFRSPEFTVRSFGLIQSRLTPEGPVYDPLAAYPLDG